MKATVDSGAAIPIVPRTLVKQILKFWRQSRGDTAAKTTFGNDKTASLRPSDERIGDIRKIDKIKIIYGNSTFEFTEHVVFLGKIIGEAFIVEKGSEILLAVTNIIENGWKRKVVFDEQKVEVLDSENKVIISGLRDPFTGLWSLDLQTALLYNDQRDTRAVNALRVSRRGLRMTDQRLVVLAHECHRDWGHLHPEKMALVFHLAPHKVPVRFQDLTPSLIISIFEHRECLACKVHNSNRLPRQVGSGIERNIGACWGVDVVTMSVATMGRCTKVIQFVELATGFPEAILVKTENAGVMIEALDHIIRINETHGHRIFSMRFDASKITGSEIFGAALLSRKINPNPAAPGQQHQDPPERYVQTIKKKVATMFADQLSLGSSYWGPAWLAANNYLKAFPNKHTTCSPYEMLTGEPFDTFRFRYCFGMPGVVTRETRTIARGMGGLAEMRPQNSLDGEGELAFAVGYPQAMNSGTFVVIPGRNFRVFERYHFRPLHTIQPTLTEEKLNLLRPTETEGGVVTFRSPAPDSVLDQSIVASIPRPATPFPLPTSSSSSSSPTLVQSSNAILENVIEEEEEMRNDTGESKHTRSGRAYRVAAHTRDNGEDSSNSDDTPTRTGLRQTHVAKSIRSSRELDGSHKQLKVMSTWRR